MKKIDLAYLAGFFDGEGSICIENNTRRGYYQLHVTASNTNREILEQFVSAFGGSINCQSLAEGNHKECWNWTTRDFNAELTLRKLFPYLRVKRPRAKLALEYREARTDCFGCKPMPEAEVVLRESYRLRMKALS